MRARTVSIALVIVGIAAAVKCAAEVPNRRVGPSVPRHGILRPTGRADQCGVTITHEAGPNSDRSYLVHSSGGRAAIGTLSGAEADRWGVSQPG